MKPAVLTLTGPTGAGKSTLVRMLLAAESDTFRPQLIPKYTTRLPRTDDGGEVICVNEAPDQRNSLPESCDIVYEQNEQRYGLALDTVFRALRDRRAPLVILNDVRALEDVRAAFGPVVRSLFVFREGASLTRLEELAMERGVEDAQDTRRRLTKSRAIYRIYIENIHLFDHVVVNAGPLRNTERQVEAIVDSIERDATWPLQEIDS